MLFRSEKDYADKIIDLIDPKKRLIQHRLYRDSCMEFSQVLVKGLNILGRDLNKTLIVDNNPTCFAFQVNN